MDVPLSIVHTVLASRSSCADHYLLQSCGMLKIVEVQVIGFTELLQCYPHAWDLLLVYTHSINRTHGADLFVYCNAVQTAGLFGCILRRYIVHAACSRMEHSPWVFHLHGSSHKPMHSPIILSASQHGFACDADKSSSR